jgi:hypothetical protein
MLRSTERSIVGAVVSVLGFGALLGGCSDIYTDRRETVLFGADNAVAANIAVQTVDPWPPASANRYIPGNGSTVATAVQRYRTGRVIQPQGNGTSSTYQQQQSQQQQLQQQQQAPQQASTGTGAPAGIPVQ